ncbi:phosphoadenosine phosphosulfate reductase [Cronobacter dublinensis subsp. dublinensis]|nr:phosphoadenosine phosphosulfate reductase [Cronobacter dublinensis subsp. dublinensis]EGT5673053.1 phosphoadenosine phosphosulfate reductase [Cronobacter dublinensis subsp. dublinensis]EGT5677729.1 phosphoadenosine phosphosulfate reductase [Cronobacter dublinensis subsp. dublinensis]EGT5686938.1 phosphoadenosine phosphosulfate reductase [Cronobacter dublinensis subsp. dublinensis]EGT5689225.1 phosphoadenosine phosphosulfate reductase [Cronobacter dublinensis subsp. dublinensis]
MSKAAMIIVPTDISKKIREIEVAYQHYLNEFRIPADHKIVVNFSAGKDSTATATIAHHLFGDRVQNVMADTDNEHELTIEFGRTIHEQIGCAPVKIVKRIYTQEEFDARRLSLKKNWSKRQAIRSGAYRGVIMPSLSRSDTPFGRAWQKTAERWGIEFDTPLEAALSVLHPSGNSFLDAALLHGMFPMLRNRFCTDELKIQVAFDSAIKPMLDAGDVVVQWSGVRGDESAKRAGYERFSTDQRDPEFLYNFLPIHQWTAADVFALHKHFGIKPNPLYTQGAARVGCMNCVLSNKEEIAQTAARWPEHIEKHHAWEKKVRLASRWVHWMSVGTESQAWMRNQLGVREVTWLDEDEFTGEEIAQRKQYSVNLGNDVLLYGLNPDVQRIEWSGFYGPRGTMGAPSALDVVEWAKTGRGGKVYDLVKASLDTSVCSSRYGLCE